MGFRDRIIERLGYQVEEVESFVPDTQNRAMSAPSREAVVVTETSALSLVAVSRALSVLETAMMQIPVNVHRGHETIQQPAWLDMPDVENNVSQAEWLGTTLFHMAVFGNAFWLVQRNPRGIVNVKNIHPSDVSVQVDQNNVIVYQVGSKRYTSKDIVHIKLWKKVAADSLLGEGPIQRHKIVS